MVTQTILKIGLYPWMLSSFWHGCLGKFSNADILRKFPYDAPAGSECTAVHTSIVMSYALVTTTCTDRTWRKEPLLSTLLVAFCGHSARFSQVNNAEEEQFIVIRP